MPKWQVCIVAMKNDVPQPIEAIQNTKGYSYSCLALLKGFKGLPSYSHTPTTQQLLGIYGLRVFVSLHVTVTRWVLSQRKSLLPSTSIEKG